MDGPHSRPKRCEEEKNLSPLPGNEPRSFSPINCCYTDWAIWSLHKSKKLLVWRDVNWCWRKPINHCLIVQIAEKAVQSISYTSRNESITAGCHVIGTRQYAPVARLWTSVCPIGFMGRAPWGNVLQLRSRRKYGRHDNVHLDVYRDLRPSPPPLPVSNKFPPNTGTREHNSFTIFIQHIYIVLIQIQNLKFMLHKCTALLHPVGYMFGLSTQCKLSI